MTGALPGENRLCVAEHRPVVTGQFGLHHFGDDFAVGPESVGEDALAGRSSSQRPCRREPGLAAAGCVGDSGLDDLADLVFAGGLRHVGLDVAISACSLAASSGRLPLVKLSTIAPLPNRVDRTAICSASVSSSRLSISLERRADLTIRRVVRRCSCWAFMVMMSVPIFFADAHCCFLYLPP